MPARRLIYAALAGAAVAGAVTGGWFYLAGRAENAIAEWAETRRAEGVDVRWREMDVAGFPLRIDMAFMDVRADARFEKSRVRARVDRVDLRLYAIEPGAVRFRAAGPLDATVSHPEGAFDLLADIGAFDGRAYLALQEQRRVREFSGALTETALSVDGAPGTVRVERADIVVKRPAQRTVDPEAIDPQGLGFRGALVARGIAMPARHLPAEMAAILPPRIDGLAATVDLFGEMHPAAATRENLIAWRDAGGSGDVSDFRLAWGPIDVSGDGSFALDDALQPEGAFTLRIVGLDQLITLLQEGGMIRAREAALARLTLSVLARTPPQGGPPVAEIPVTVQDGRLLAGPVPLMRIPTIEWP